MPSAPGGCKGRCQPDQLNWDPVALLIMLWSLPFALFLIVVLLLRYWHPWGPRCPQCGARRPEGAPLCPECGWIYEVPGEEDEDYGEEPEQEEFRIP